MRQAVRHYSTCPFDAIRTRLAFFVLLRWPAWSLLLSVWWKGAQLGKKTKTAGSSAALRRLTARMMRRDEAPK